MSIGEVFGVKTRVRKSSETVPLSLCCEQVLKRRVVMRSHEFCHCFFDCLPGFPNVIITHSVLDKRQTQRCHRMMKEDCQDGTDRTGQPGQVK